MKKSLFFKVFFMLIWVGSAQGQVDELAARLLSAYQAGKPLPALSYEANLDMASAYQIQAAFIKKRLAQDKIAGFKAGLTSDKAQLHFGLNRPIFGVIFKKGNFSNKKEISLKNYHQLMIETELGFVVRRPIVKTVHSINELKTYIEKVVPLVELADVGFAQQSISATDLVAANAAAAGYIVYDKVNWLKEDINSVIVSLLWNKEIVNQGQGEDAFGDQWEALRWLVNQVLAHGWLIEKGHLLITGALGEMVAAKPGVYRAQFNQNAVLEFSVVP